MGATQNNDWNGVFTKEQMKGISHEGMLKVRTDLVRVDPSLLLFKDAVNTVGKHERKEWLRTHDVVYVDFGNARYITFLMRFVEELSQADQLRWQNLSKHVKEETRADWLEASFALLRRGTESGPAVSALTAQTLDKLPRLAHCPVLCQRILEVIERFFHEALMGEYERGQIVVLAHEPAALPQIPPMPRPPGSGTPLGSPNSAGAAPATSAERRSLREAPSVEPEVRIRNEPRLCQSLCEGGLSRCCARPCRLPHGHAGMHCCAAHDVELAAAEGSAVAQTHTAQVTRPDELASIETRAGYESAEVPFVPEAEEDTGPWSLNRFGREAELLMARLRSILGEWIQEKLPRFNGDKGFPDIFSVCSWARRARKILGVLVCDKRCTQLPEVERNRALSMVTDYVTQASKAEDLCRLRPPDETRGDRGPAPATFCLVLGGSEELAGQVISVIQGKHDYRAECIAAARGEHATKVWISWEGGPSTKLEVCDEICSSLTRALLPSQKCTWTNSKTEDEVRHLEVSCPDAVSALTMERGLAGASFRSSSGNEVETSPITVGAFTPTSKDESPPAEDRAMPPADELRPPDRAEERAWDEMPIAHLGARVMHPSVAEQFIMRVPERCNVDDLAQLSGAFVEHLVGLYGVVSLKGFIKRVLTVAYQGLITLALGEVATTASTASSSSGARSAERPGCLGDLERFDAAERIRILVTMLRVIVSQRFSWNPGGFPW